jgi:hypothetical protein
VADDPEGIAAYVLYGDHLVPAPLMNRSVPGVVFVACTDLTFQRKSSLYIHSPDLKCRYHSL